MNLLLAIACSVLGFVPSSTAPQQGQFSLLIYVHIYIYISKTFHFHYIESSDGENYSRCANYVLLPIKKLLVQVSLYLYFILFLTFFLSFHLSLSFSLHGYPSLFSSLPLSLSLFHSLNWTVHRFPYTYIYAVSTEVLMRIHNNSRLSPLQATLRCTPKHTKKGIERER